MIPATRLSPLGQAASCADHILKGEKPAAIEDPISALGHWRTSPTQSRQKTPQHPRNYRRGALLVSQPPTPLGKAAAGGRRQPTSPITVPGGWCAWQSLMTSKLTSLPRLPALLIGRCVRRIELARPNLSRKPSHPLKIPTAMTGRRFPRHGRSKTLAPHSS
jgi:hypothetical protein